MVGKTNGNLYAKEGGIEYEQLVNYTMLYNYGNECEEITGGWENTYSNKGGTYTENATNIYLYVKGTTYIKISGTANAIDLTPYSKAYIDWIYSKDDQNYGMNRFACGTIKVASMEKIGSGGCLALWSNQDALPLSGSGLYYFDVSDINVPTYIQFSAQTNSSTYSTTSTMYHCFLVKNDNWQELANIAGITAGSIDDILTNSTTLLSSKEAVKFMIYNCTGDFMISAIQNETFLNALNNSAYKTIIQANEHWNKFLNMVA